MSYKFLSFCFIFAVAVTCPAIVPAQEKSGLSVEEMSFCKAIEYREPVGIDTVFTDRLERIYCFTRVTGAPDPTIIYHLWYFNNEEKVRVPLEVKSASWRTWSSKKIIKGETGDWRVDILDANGNLLKSGSFTINEEAE